MIKYSRNTVGCNVRGEIFLHPELYKYPKLYTAVVTHEMKHTNSFTRKDIVIDLFNDDLKGNKKEFYKFIFLHPRTLFGFMPVTKIGKNWCFDLELSVAWALIIGIIYFVGVNL